MSKLHKGFSVSTLRKDIFFMDLISHRQEATIYFERISKECIHYLSVDCVVFGFHENQLKVLLLKWKGTDAWSLPGGFIRKDESVDDAAQRCLRERTGLKKIYLQHFDVFGDANRYDERKTFSRINLNLTNIKWSERTVSIGYFALVEYSKVNPAPDFLSDRCAWFKTNEIPSLLFDHNKIIRTALRALPAKLPSLPIRHLLPPNFTMPELQKLYETILGRQLDARNFQRKVNALGILDKLKKRREGTPHKSPYLFKFSTARYTFALKEGTLVFS
jgi:8-oxo-dGTP diphosphatase